MGAIELGLKLPEYIQMHLERFPVVHVWQIATAPAERSTARNRLQARGVDSLLFE